MAVEGGGTELGKEVETTERDEYEFERVDEWRLVLVRDLAFFDDFERLFFDRLLFLFERDFESSLSFFLPSDEEEIDGEDIDPPGE